uniref:Integrin, alpha 2b n=1 Tax=Lepisosteus oculatus TaxID=7918 RepID=W5N6U3_LEPOC
PLLFAALLCTTSGINIDLKTPSIYTGPEGSYFGFSVDFYQTIRPKVHVVVGAPKANTSQPGVTEGGSVFLCSWPPQGGTCDVLPFDMKGDGTYKFGHLTLTEHKSHQWFGASVRSKQDLIAACAPLYEWNVEDLGDTSGKTPVGICQILDMKSNTWADYSPCRKTNTETFYDHNRYRGDRRYCEAGFSSDITQDGKILLGAPGGYFFQGQIIAANMSEIFRVFSPQNPIRTMSTETLSLEYQESEYDEYYGYSTAVGEFTGDSTPDYVVGVPNDRHTAGSVKIYNGMSSYILYIIHTFHGTQVASFFGHSVAVTDINNDGRDDVLIGAPLFMEHQSDKKLHEVGQVSLFLQRQLGAFSEKPTQRLTGGAVYGRFGTSIAPLGDIDQDGFNDIAVGAPFSAGEGRVFIFMGQSDGLRAQYAQLLESPFPSHALPAAFGFALRGGTDIDDNGYPDLVVGGWGAGRVAVYRSLAVIRAKATLSLSPSVLNPEEKKCHLPKTSISVSCFNITMCVSVSGKNIPEQIDLDTEVNLDRMKQRLHRRTLFLDSNQPQDRFNMSIKRNTGLMCKTFTAYLRDESELRDKLSPIFISLNYSFVDSRSPVAVLHGQKAAVVQLQTRIVLDCGPDNICIPDLRLSAAMQMERLLIGDDNPVLLTIGAENRGEGAYETELYIWPPPHTHYQGVLRQREGFSGLMCNQKKENRTVVVMCNLGNPMKTGEKLNAGLYFSVGNLEEAGSSVLFQLQIKSKNSQSPNSNMVSLRVNVSAVAHLELRGGSSPAEQVLPIAKWEPKEPPQVIDDIGPLVEHVYELQNLGPSTVNARVEVEFPTHYQGELLLYVFANASEEHLTCFSASPEIDTLKRWSCPLLRFVGLMQMVWAAMPNSHRINKRQAEVPGPQRKDPVHVVLHRPVQELCWSWTSLNCSTAVCLTFSCEAVGLERGRSAVVKIMSRLWVQSFLKRPYEDFFLQSVATYTVYSMPYKVKPEVLPSGSAETQTAVEWRALEGEKEVPVWWIVVAIVAGLFLLALFSFIFWKLGFFKRNRPPKEDTQELKPEQSEYAEMPQSGH